MLQNLSNNQRVDFYNYASVLYLVPDSFIGQRVDKNCRILTVTNNLFPAGY